MASSSTSPDPALLAAIIADPDDDSVRLVAADWLEEHGEAERAEFIRVQVELAAGPGCSIPESRGLYRGEVLCTRADCRYCALRRRERELLGNANWLHWADPVPAFTGRLNRPTSDILRTNWNFRRGFVHAITCAAADWLAHADAILAAQPVRAVTLTTWPELDWCGDPFAGACGLKLAGGAASAHLGWVHQDGDPNAPWARRHVPGLLAAEWPGITFHLPQPAAPP